MSLPPLPPDDELGLPRPIWLNHFHGVEDRGVRDILVAQEAVLNKLSVTWQQTYGWEDEKSRQVAVNLIMAASLALQHKHSSISQEEMVATLALYGPYEGFRELMREKIIWRMHAQDWRNATFLAMAGLASLCGFILSGIVILAP